MNEYCNSQILTMNNNYSHSHNTHRIANHSAGNTFDRREQGSPSLEMELDDAVANSRYRRPVHRPGSDAV